MNQRPKAVLHSASSVSSPNPSPSHFPTTEWTLVSRLRAADPEVSLGALEQLCTTYQYPLYCMIRRQGLSHHDAEDVLQDFFAKLIRLGAFHDLTGEKGRLRGFLSKSLQRFLSTHRQREGRRSEREISASDVRLRIDSGFEKKFEVDLARNSESPDVMFDRQWGVQLLRRVLDRLQAAYAKKNQLPLFLELRPVLLTGGSLRGHDVAGMAQRLGKREAAVRVAMLRLLRNYRDLLLDEVRQTVERPEEIEEELRYLTSLMEKPPS